MSENHKISKNPIRRRHFLQLLAYGAASSMILPNSATAGIQRNLQPRQLAFHHLHTGEKLSVTFFENGHYVSDALHEINVLLRDFRTNDTHLIDPELLNQLYDLRLKLGVNKPFQIISGYRSPATNAQLRKHSSGVAKKSLHMQGKAIDIRVEGIDSRIIRNAALDLHQGGVGYYQRSNFVHLDTGRVRHW